MYKSFYESRERKVYSVLELDNPIKSLKIISSELREMGIFLNYEKNGEDEISLIFSKDPFEKGISNEAKQKFMKILKELKIRFSRKFNGLELHFGEIKKNTLEGTLTTNIHLLSEMKGKIKDKKIEEIKESLATYIFEFAKNMRDKKERVLVSRFHRNDDRFEMTISYG
jgi:hypothetical protein